MRQEWCCEACGGNGAVIVADNATISSVISVVAEDHGRLFGHRCRSTLHIRVRNRFMCTPERWELAKQRAKYLASRFEKAVRA